MSHRRVLIFSEAVTLAHVARPLVLAQESRNRLDIEFAADPSAHHWFKREGWVPHVITSLQSHEFMRRLRWGECVFKAEELRRHVYEDIVLMKNIRPDVVIGDFRLSLSISCRLEAIPYIALGNAYWMIEGQSSIPVPELPLTRFAGVVIGQWLFDRFAPWVMNRHSIAFNRVRNEFGLANIAGGLPQVYLDADLLALVDLSQCYSHVIERDAMRFMGPCVWNPPVELPEWWGDVPDNVPVAFISLGSSGQLRCVRSAVQACLDEGWNVLLATAGRVFSEELQASARLFVADFLPGMATMRRSDVLICNGGSPMCQIAMVCGKPVIGIPSNLDQFLNMIMIRKVGLGVELRPEQLTVEKVRKALRQIGLNDNRDALDRMGRFSSDWLNRARLADLIEDFIG